MARKPTPPPDPALLEFLGALADQLANSRTSEAVDAAQALMFDAFESDNQRTRVALARKALRISPDCADAYLLLSQEAAATPAEALALLAEGTAAGERALGPAAFTEDVGHFWGLIETRPYMRTRHQFALALWEAGRREEAAGHAADLLRLNPGDNQGLRYTLLNWLLTLGRDDEAATLLKRYRDEDGAQMAWPAALAAFRRHGDKAAARKALQRATAANGFVAAYLTGKRKLPKAMPPYYSPGDRSEAAIYVAEGGAEAWASAPAAVEWLRAQP